MDRDRAKVRRNRFTTPLYVSGYNLLPYVNIIFTPVRPRVSEESPNEQDAQEGDVTTTMTTTRKVASENRLE